MKVKEKQGAGETAKLIKEKKFEGLSKTYKESTDEFKDRWIQNNNSGSMKRGNSRYTSNNDSLGRSKRLQSTTLG